MRCMFVFIQDVKGFIPWSATDSSLIIYTHHPFKLSPTLRPGSAFRYDAYG